jgi:ATP-binding cassette subfamily B protein
VCFSYTPERAPALDGVDLVARPGEVVAITGDNGAGKSTLIRLLCRLYDPTGGSIRLDGVDLREMDPTELHSRIAVLFQDPVSYYVSARENLWFGDVNLAEESPRILGAARKMGVDQFVTSLPKAYDTVLGTWFDGGAELSIGQWKRLALARALVRDAQVLLLDEPTAGVDAEGEARLLSEIEKREGERLVVIVSHRISTVSRADRIYVLQKGRVVQTGSHRELLASQGAYARLWEEQHAG